jgi:hypothetical protein
MTIATREYIDCPNYTFPGFRSEPSQCRIRIFQHFDRPTVVIATEIPGRGGLALTTCVEMLASQVVHDFAIDQDTMTWVEHYNWGLIGESFHRVEFDVKRGAGKFRYPRWTRMSRPGVEYLIGGALSDEDRHQTFRPASRLR